jgi:hypothetical protein
MAGFKGQGTANAVLNYLYNSASFSATIYVALFTSDPTATGGGTEVTGTGYARVAVTANTTNFPAASGGSLSNGTLISFGTAGSDWAAGSTKVTGVAFVKTSAGALGASDIIHYAPLSTARNILNGDPVQIPVGAAVITEA